MYKQGDIIAVKYPFSDFTEKSKLRPAIIISNSASNSLDNDLLICPITTNIRNTSFSFTLRDDNLTEALPYQSEVRCNKITTIRTLLVLGKVSELKPEYLDQLLKVVKNCF